MQLIRLVPALIALCAGAPAFAGQTVEVTVTGSVEFNGVQTGTLGGVQVNEGATLRFRVDSDTFVNSPTFPTRGYPIDKASFSLAFDSATVALQSPFPAGTTPYFVLRNNDPAVDGFFVATNVNSFGGVPLNVNGNFGPFQMDYHVTYGGSALPSLDILDALGSWDFTGLSVFNWTLDDGPFQPFGILFESMTIAVVDGTWTDKGHALTGVAGDPKLVGSGTLAAATANTLALGRAAPSATAALFFAVSSTPVAFKGGLLMPVPFFTPVVLTTNALGASVLPFVMPSGAPAGTTLWLQYAIKDAAAVQGIALSNALLGVTP